MKVIQGNREATEAKLKAVADKRKARYREIMLTGKDSVKAIHAAVRWYGMRQKWETESQPEFMLYCAMLQLLAEEFTPEWIQREFPPRKFYKGQRWGMKDYYTAVKAVTDAAPFAGDADAVNSFLWDYDNDDLREFVMAGLFLLDELRAANGEPTMAEEWAGEMGVDVVHSTIVENGRTILLDDQGNVLARIRRPHKGLKVVK